MSHWWKQPTHWKTPWWWERSKAKGERGDRIRWLGGSMDLNLSKLWEIVKDKGAWHAASLWGHKSQTLLRDWTTTTISNYSNFLYVCHYLPVQFSSVSSVAQLCLTLWDPLNSSTPGLSVHHHLPEFTQTHVHWVGDAIQPSHSLSSPSPPAPNPSQHQSLFQWVNSLHEVAKVLELQL